MKLYGYWRSSAAYRVRIAMHLKALNFDSIPVHLVKDGGEQHQEDYVRLNPTHLVPTLVDGDITLNQSLAIIEYLEEAYQGISIFPEKLELKMQAKAMAYDIACEIHPVNNLRVQQYLVKELGASDEAKLSWSHHWMANGFAALEAKLVKSSGKFSIGDDISIADICLVPQVYNANRFKLDMSPYPNINRIVHNCNKESAFIKALPENQPDAI